MVRDNKMRETVFSSCHSTKAPPKNQMLLLLYGREGSDGVDHVYVCVLEE